MTVKRVLFTVQLNTNHLFSTLFSTEQNMKQIFNVDDVEGHVQGHLTLGTCTMPFSSLWRTTSHIEIAAVEN